ncbi:aminotransferase class IV [Marinitoga lauensis]|uniref:aminotransferase class IV n=1 Tax=Marinitoga lauensis TaxID=2201189 RepID=UPI001013BD9D|nr:aminotransferase class IV [Marinitoga lauensis]
MIYYNGKYFKKEIPFKINEGLMYGQGVFETLKVINGYVEFFDLHYERLLEGCRILNIICDISKKEIFKEAKYLIKINKITNGSLKINVLKNKNKADIIITTNDKIYTEKMKKTGYEVIFAESTKFSQNPLNYIKSNNYVINIIELNRALNLKKNESIFLNERNEITEGSISNIFFVKDSKIYTPKIECGLLNGIIRKILISKLNVKEDIIKRKDIKDFDYAFLTNSLMRVMPIKRFEEIKYEFDYEYIKWIEKKIEPK